jgi:hypothetical protein
VTSLTESELVERTLRALACNVDYHDLREACGLDELVGPESISWSMLLAAIMEGLTRGWVADAHLFRRDGVTHCVWSATTSGDRAIQAWIRRNRKEPT